LDAELVTKFGQTGLESPRVTATALLLKAGLRLDNSGFPLREDLASDSFLFRSIYGPLKGKRGCQAPALCEQIRGLCIKNPCRSLIGNGTDAEVIKERLLHHLVPKPLQNCVALRPMHAHRPRKYWMMSSDVPGVAGYMMWLLHGRITDEKGYYVNCARLRHGVKPLVIRKRHATKPQKPSAMAGWTGKPTSASKTSKSNWSTKSKPVPAGPGGMTRGSKPRGGFGGMMPGQRGRGRGRGGSRGGFGAVRGRGSVKFSPVAGGGMGERLLQRFNLGSLTNSLRIHGLLSHPGLWLPEDLPRILGRDPTIGESRAWAVVCRLAKDLLLGGNINMF